MRFSLLLGGLLLAIAAQAQQPALPGAPQVPPPSAPGPTTTPGTEAPLAAPLPGPTTNYVLGYQYQVQLLSGTTFTGMLTAMSLDNLEFDTKDLGHLLVPRTNVRQMTSLQRTAKLGLRPGYYDSGNGNRLFFGPTARNLRKGEGVLQDVYVYLVGLNYGITDNISVGGYASLFPWVDIGNQFLMLTPKLSVPVRNDLHAAAGVLYIRVPNFDGGGVGAGLLYGALTWGSADNNFTAGLGYGFASGNVGSTPTILLGGQRRISRRVSLMTENYLIANSEAGIFGLYGFKMNWRRTNLGVAAGYFAPFSRRNGEQALYTTYIIPVYVDFSFRFGKPYQKTLN